ncbi:Domain of unknown function DUF4371 [Cinara cedri]|uniref:DUF4371 domain-containing protein n=1 Tax=Cinara cedri TaxID=506608 RepID=A0A5E4MND7_9HEMI|nr:Domain of unknown function DUF4371 [Cinara cedri]
MYTEVNKVLLFLHHSQNFDIKHDIALRRNIADKCYFVDLLKFRIDSVFGQVILNDIVSQVNNSVAFSLLADETADIAGKEQLSIGVRYIDINYVVHEEFIGYSEIYVLNAEGVSRSILESKEKYGLNMLKLFGLEFDGCSTMSEPVVTKLRGYKF